MGGILRQWAGVSEGGCYNARTDPVLDENWPRSRSDPVLVRPLQAHLTLESHPPFRLMCHWKRLGLLHRLQGCYSTRTDPTLPTFQNFTHRWCRRLSSNAEIV